MAAVKKVSPKKTVARKAPARKATLKKIPIPKVPASKSTTDSSAKEDFSIVASSQFVLPQPAEDLKGIDRRKLVELVQERLTAEGKSVQTLASDIGMPPRVAAAVFQGISPPASHRVVQFLRYLGIPAADAPRIGAVVTRPRGNHIFISYCHRDSEYLERLLVHLKPLQRDGMIDAWVDTRLQAGDRWRKEIDTALKKARAAVLLVSADFLASDFVFKNELPPLLKAAEENGTLIIPVVLKPCRFTRSKELRDFQSINSPDEPLSVLDETGRELLYDSIAQRIEAVFS